MDIKKLYKAEEINPNFVKRGKEQQTITNNRAKGCFWHTIMECRQKAEANYKKANKINIRILIANNQKAI
ncbi:hypothetical protein [Anaerotignum sp.]|uniref:hypothetical protein n=1 Tax=Anaerotignum sp. TaxID=2039241 RepID=UPI0028AD7EC9|nr:hypothetical protein [Anaerotignum sp.]